MTQKDKQLLLRDLCARLPYGVKVQYKGHNTIIKNKLLTGSDLDCNMEYYKPYLRPMSSMTEEEKKEFYKVVYDSMNIDGISPSVYVADWEVSKHFDVHGLIEKGLAIAINENNNPYNE